MRRELSDVWARGPAISKGAARLAESCGEADSPSEKLAFCHFLSGPKAKMELLSSEPEGQPVVAVFLSRIARGVV